MQMGYGCSRVRHRCPTLCFKTVLASFLAKAGIAVGKRFSILVCLETVSSALSHSGLLQNQYFSGFDLVSFRTWNNAPSYELF